MSRDEKAPFIVEFLDAIRRREWWAVRRLLLTLCVPALLLLVQNGGGLGTYFFPILASWLGIFLILALTEISARPRFADEFSESSYPRTIRGLVSFGEDDAATFATLGRGSDVAKVLNAVRDPQFRFGVIYGESGCGKTSLLHAGVLPQLKVRGYACHIDDINNQEQPLDLVVRLLRSAVPVVPRTGSDSVSDGTLMEHAWLAHFDTVARPVFLFLDQFEQLFLHYRRGDQEEQFLSFLTLWWTRHPASQLRILVSIREDYLAKLAAIQERLSYAQTIHNHLRLRKFRPAEALDVLRSMASESKLEFDEAAVVKACCEELASREDGTVSPVDLQILATAVGDVRNAPGRGFTANTLRSLGGLEGALERYLLAQLDSVPTSRKAALAILRVLSELRQGVLAGLLSAKEISEKLGQEYGAESITGMIAWLSHPGVRLIVEKETPDGKRYRLVHDRLVTAVRKVSGQVLEAADRASLLLDQRVTEYLNNHRSYRFLLAWREWWFVRRHLALVEWGSREDEKRELLLRSGKRVTAWCVSGAAFVLSLCLGWGAWEYQPSVLRWRTQQELASDFQQISDLNTLREIATTLATAGEVRICAGS